MGLKEDYSYCENIIRENSKSFYKAFSYLPEEKANDIYAVYGFCRIADDIADVNKDKNELVSFKRDWIEFKNGNIPEGPVWRALKNTFDNYDMNHKAFDDMISGQFSDFEFTQPKTQEDLENYCYYVAGTVGLMILPILSKRHKELSDNAVLLGKAMQITNILRDIGEDFDNGRIYLPLDIMERHQVTTNDICNKKITRNFIQMWEHEAGLAEKYYSDAARDFNLYDKESIFSVKLSAYIYKEILNEVRKSGYDCLTKKNYTGRFRKMMIMMNLRLKG